MDEILFQPKTRLEYYLATAAGMEPDLIPEDTTPKTNIEHYIAALAGLFDGELPEAKTAKEYYIKTFVENNPGGFV